MKIKIQFLTGLICLITNFLNAQTGTIKGSISGIENPSGNSILVTLLTVKDNSIVKTQIPEDNGSFEFLTVKEGNYTIVIENENYKPYQSKIITISKEQLTVSLPTIVLQKTEANSLKEVVVQKKKAFVENKIDKTVLNVDALISAAGGDAMDVLEKAPGIIVDENGTITFKGKSGVAVFIDDKPTYLSGADLEAYLKSLPASTLNQIELMTNPPAKYDAAGGAGIINIITKKTKVKGFNGSATSRVSQGKRAQTREGLNLNYLNDKVRLFGNAGYAYQNAINDLYIFRRFKNPDLTTKSLFDQYSMIDRKAQNTNGAIGMDYYVTEKSTIGVGLSGIFKSGNQRSDVNSILSDASHVVDSTIVAKNREKEKFKNGSINLNYRYDIDSIGTKYTMDFDYLRYSTGTNQRFDNTIYQPDNSISNQDELLGDLPAKINIYSLKTDYSHPLKNDGLIETGYKISISKTDNVADYRDVINGVALPNYDSSNHFKYNEMINAAYVNFNASYKRFTFQTGLRLENTYSKGNQLGNPEKPASQFKKSYTNLFPTIFVQYKLDSIGNNQLVLSYGKRINRPYFQDLNPFVSPLDKFTFYSGNPYLNPSFAYNYELSYRYKGLFSTTLSYGDTKDDINETIEINNGIYYSRPGNIGKSQYYSINFTVDTPIYKWWKTNIYSEVTHSVFKSKLYTEDLNTSGTFWSSQINNSFTFSKNWSGELSGNYQTKIIATQFILGARGSVNLAVKTKIMEGKGSLKFSVNDIFYGGIVHGTINNLQLTDASWVNRRDSRFAALTFAYSFGKAFKSKEQHDATGADSEKNRVKD
ncbi:MAG TPA: outer membrane beta-barrel family protein [Flavobacterium sp.]|uniref:outer membrane beta-barrel family protein n=1 Tax=Flavobacterium sp. TaxID=239 RepID=UPI002B95E563|nr:outer membrane beta-barrel family protein [Flavobacterium sp.]HNP32449.1 outer membrane beta-barrel family protein [Flavobacterium sp.]